MSLVVKHSFVSNKQDSGDTSLIRPTNWNANHTLEGSVFTEIDFLGLGADQPLAIGDIAKYSITTVGADFTNSVTMGTGTKVFTGLAGRSFTVGSTVVVANSVNTLCSMVGTVVSSSSGNLEVDVVDFYRPSGQPVTASTWHVYELIPLNISCGEGIYEFDYMGSADTTISNSCLTMFFPNSLSYDAGSMLYMSRYTSGNPTVAGFQSATPAAALDGVDFGMALLGASLILRLEGKISTYLKAKIIQWKELRKVSSTSFLTLDIDTFWNDTTTEWTSLGSIAIPFDQSVTLLIRRVA